MREEARDWFRRLEAGDAEARRLWTWFREISLVEFQRIYDRLLAKTGKAPFNLALYLAHAKLAKELAETLLTPSPEIAKLIGIDSFLPHLLFFILFFYFNYESIW